MPVDRNSVVAQRRDISKTGIVCGLMTALLLAWCMTAGGCNRRQDPAAVVAAMNDSNIRRVANLYTAFQLRNGGRGPKNEAEFKQFIQQKMSKQKLAMMQVDPNDVEGLFRSERDGKPFTVRYGVSGGLTSTAPVVFEQEGRDGMRQVAFTNGPVEDVNDARYGELLQGKAQTTGT
jgi:hypothetical protein